ncbi:uncharacterized protein TEOVI_000128200 [Trypanosoma equiperdum]|uniref:Uncharacterized protein n=2 Tax=Trypanozoon TaxID=39700 RepID=Q38DX0_TRYB2|nr:hypothetical protein, unlikely [Trypanosoma brucei brucei TREU927]EAN77000.1 hypothetical protein, unlikely [Trypanosoma brucei brucei TREU927]SCU69713.1 hypothetical protein, conserved [Trypanosoma equiperdum]
MFLVEGTLFRVSISFGGFALHFFLSPVSLFVYAAIRCFVLLQKGTVLTHLANSFAILLLFFLKEKRREGARSWWPRTLVESPTPCLFLFSFGFLLPSSALAERVFHRGTFMVFSPALLGRFIQRARYVLPPFSRCLVDSAIRLHLF